MHRFAKTDKNEFQLDKSSQAESIESIQSFLERTVESSENESGKAHFSIGIGLTFPLVY
jgi:hypothetical protein